MAFEIYVGAGVLRVESRFVLMLVLEENGMNLRRDIADRYRRVPEVATRKDLARTQVGRISRLSLKDVEKISCASNIRSARSENQVSYGTDSDIDVCFDQCCAIYPRRPLDARQPMP